MTLLEKLEILMRKNELNKRQLSLKADLPYSTVDNLWKRNTDSMRLPTFKILCETFGVTMESMAYDDKDIVYVSDLVDGPAASSDLTEREAELLRRYRYIEESGKKIVDMNLNMQYDLCSEKGKNVSNA